MTAGPVYYCLLIGIDRYPKQNFPLNSCARDVREIRRCLEEQKGFAALHIIVLAAAPEGDSDTSTADEEGRPIYDNLVASLQQITKLGNAGDVVYIHYSGHGTRVPPGRRNAFSNHNTGDLAWVVLQDSKAGIRYLWGSQLAQHIRHMVAKGLRVTLVLDCCYAGSVLRTGLGDDGDARYLHYDAEIDAEFLPADYQQDQMPGHLLDQLPEVGRSVSRNSSMLPTWMIDPKGFSILTACGPHEIARHIWLENGLQYGRLSYLLIETLRDPDLGGFRGHFEVIYDRLRARFLQLYPTQTPMWYGNNMAGFLRAGDLYETSVPTFPVTQQRDDRLQLEGGQAHGFCDGDRLDVLELGCSVTIKQARALTSDLEIADSSALDTDVKKGWRARARTLLSLRQYSVQLDFAPSGASALPEEQKTHSSRPWLTLHVETNGRTNLPTFRVTPSSSISGGYQVRDSSNQVIKHLHPETLDTHQALDAVEHLMKFYLFRDICSKSSTPPLYRVQLVNVSASNVVYLPGTVAEVKHNDRLHVVFENLGSEIFYVHLYNLRPCWDIANMLKGSFEVIYPQSHPKEPESIKTRFGRRGSRIFRMNVTIPEELVHLGHRQCDEFIKVLVTKRPTSFEPLVLPRFGKVPERIDHRFRGYEVENLDDSEYWDALTYSLHISQNN